MDSYQANLQPHLFLLNSASVSIPLQLFLGSSSIAFFSLNLSSLKVRFFSGLKALRCISAFSWRLFLFYAKLFFGSLSLVLPFVSITNMIKLECLSRVAGRVITGSHPPSQTTLTHFTIPSYEFVLHRSTSFPTWGLAVKSRLSIPSKKIFGSTHQLMFSVLDLSLVLGILPLLWS